MFNALLLASILLYPSAYLFLPEILPDTFCDAEIAIRAFVNKRMAGQGVALWYHLVLDSTDHGFVPFQTNLLTIDCLI